SYASASELAEIIAESANKLLGNSVKVIYPNGSCEQLPGIILDNSKAESIGFAVNTPLSEGIMTIIKRYASEL
ncbi:MAG: hypothetical protein ACI4RH_05510, partial [Huintestinicola sp.]